jgi:glyoxylase-like metal-dependent hydrolase (beta-lactamase superfamily II)
MRAVGVHEDVVVFTSRVWQTNAVAVRSGAEAFLVDSPVFPDELEVIPGVLDQAGFRVAGLLATHADWDHLLGRLAFPELALGCGEATAARLAEAPGAPARALREWDEEHYVERPRPLALPAPQVLPVPGYCAVGEAELELHPAPGHVADGVAVVVPWARLLVCGDYLSSVEIPTISPGGAIGPYLDTLERLRGLLGRTRSVVPGHGPVMPAERALEILEQDVAYLRALADLGSQAPLPQERDTATQRRIHAANAARVAG